MNTRRQFLKRLAASAVALGLSPYRDVAVAGETYTNSRLGLSFAKASIWEYSSIADFSALRERQVLDDVCLDEAHPLKDPRACLLCSSRTRITVADTSRHPSVFGTIPIINPFPTIRPKLIERS